MLDILGSLLATVTTLVTFVFNTISSLFALITRIPAYVMMLINSINILPAFLLPWAMAYISVVVIQYILNRKAG